jgi:hypothetical protein
MDLVLLEEVQDRLKIVQTDASNSLFSGVFRGNLHRNFTLLDAPSQSIDSLPETGRSLPKQTLRRYTAYI